MTIGLSTRPRLLFVAHVDRGTDRIRIVSEACGCKKPGGALYRRAAAELGLDLSSSFVVGDISEDIDAAQLLGCEGVLVRTGWPASEGAK